MLCRKKRSNLFWGILMLASVTVGLLGWIINGRLPEEAHGWSSLMGMLSGMGIGITLVALFFMVREKIISPEKRRMEAIEGKDERHAQVVNKAFKVASLTGTGLFAVLAGICLLMQEHTLAYICVGALWVQQIVFLLACKVIDRRM